MKATLFTSKDKMEIRLENDEKIYSFPKEEKEDMITRVIEYTREKYLEELDLDEVDLLKLKKLGTTQLAKKLEKTEGIEAKMIAEILDSRGAKISSTPKKVEAEKPKAEKPKAEKPKATTTKSRKVNKVRTDKERIKATKDAQDNIKKTCSFTPFRATKALSGTIKYVVADKRTNNVYYRVDVKGKLLCCSVSADHLKIK